MVSVVKNPAAVEVEELTKRYEPAGVQALDGVTFAVEDGEVFGFLGRNGAGKSTAVRILTTLLRPTSGRAIVAGFDVATQGDQVRGVIGAALQEAALDELMTGREHLVLGARLTGSTRAAAADRAAELLEAFGLRGAADRIAARYSGGMRRRLDVAMAMVRRPKVLFLDEPTTGLDPQGRRALWAIVRDLRHGGATVFLTTQYLAEADELASRVAVVHDGRIAAIGAPDELKQRLGGATTVWVRMAGGDAARVTSLPADAELVATSDDGWLGLRVPAGDATVPRVVANLAAAGHPIERLRIQPPTLEDVFVRLTGTGIEADTGSGASTASAIVVRRGVGLPTGRR